MPNTGCRTIKIFFFSSRRRHTRYWRDWSSDVCSSDLGSTENVSGERNVGCCLQHRAQGDAARLVGQPLGELVGDRSEERRVGKSVDLGGRRIIKKKNIKEDCDIVLMTNRVSVLKGNEW